MSRSRRVSPALLALELGVMVALAMPLGISAAERIVTLGSSVTETVFALGEGGSVVARDSSSMYPAEVTALPEVGYYRAISAEGVLSQNPDLILTTSDAGPPEALDQLRSAGAELVVIEESKTIEGAMTKITQIAEALGVPERGATLRTELEEEVAAAKAIVESAEDKPSILFLMQFDGSGAAMAAGSHTGVAEMIEQAGATNVAGEINGYRDISAEAIRAANPDVVLLPSHLFTGGATFDRQILAPLLEGSSAWENDRIQTVDLALLAGFGPRTGEALAQLVELVHSAEKKP